MKKTSLIKKSVMIGALSGAVLLGIVNTMNGSVEAKEIQRDNETYYVVESGDTLSKIAEEYGVTVEELQENNKDKIKDVHVIFPEQEFKVTGSTSNKLVQSSDVDTSNTVQENQDEVHNENTGGYSGRTIVMEATAYDGYGMGGVTATGNLITSPSDKVIAVDPNVIPLGTRVYVEGYGEAIAWDTGGVIKGNIIDLNMSSSDAVQWGRRMVNVTILD